MIRTLLCSLLVVGLPAVDFGDEEAGGDRPILVTDQDAANLLAGAEERIRRLRMGTSTLDLRDHTGQPLPPGSRVQVRMLRHAFRFAAPPGAWFFADDHAQRAVFDARWMELFNAAIAPFYWYGDDVTWVGNGVSENLFVKPDRVLAWAEPRGLPVKGHPLAWNYKDPAWLPADPVQVRAHLHTFIAQAMTRYRGRIRLWDVVNEAAEFDEGSRPTLAPRFTAAIASLGPEAYVREMCAAARAADPAADRAVNEATHQLARLAKIEPLLRRLTAGEPVFEVLGMQFHQGEKSIPIDQVWAAVNRLGAYVNRIVISEITIAAATTAREAAQAEAVERFYTVLFSHPKIEELTWWNLSDQGAFQKGGGLLHADLTPKPAFTRLRTLIRERWWTPPQVLSVGADGSLKISGFYGTYEVQPGQDGPRARFEHRPGGDVQRLTLPCP